MKSRNLHQKESIIKEKENTYKNQMDVFKLKHTITEVRGSVDGLKTKRGRGNSEMSIKVIENTQSEQQRESLESQKERKQDRVEKVLKRNNGWKLSKFSKMAIKKARLFQSESERRSVVSDSATCIVHGILQARKLEWASLSLFWGSSQPRDRTQVSRIAGKFFTNWAIRESRFFPARI